MSEPHTIQSLKERVVELRRALWRMKLELARMERRYMAMKAKIKAASR